MRNKRATRKSGFCCCCALSGLHETMHRNNKNAVRSTAFLLHIAEESKGKTQ
jgi:hypothetical protein